MMVLSFVTKLFIVSLCLGICSPFRPLILSKGNNRVNKISKPRSALLVSTLDDSVDLTTTNIEPPKQQDFVFGLSDELVRRKGEAERTS